MRVAADGASFPREHRVPQQASGGAEQAHERRARARDGDLRGWPRGGAGVRYVKDALYKYTKQNK